MYCETYLLELSYNYIDSWHFLTCFKRKSEIDKRDNTHRIEPLKDTKNEQDEIYYRNKIEGNEK